MEDIKKVPIKSLKEGSSFHYLYQDDRIIMADFKIIKVTDAFVKLKKYDKYEETLSTENVFAGIPLTEEEKNIKYKDNIEELKKNIQNEIPFAPEVIGYHEMWNSWIDVDLCDMSINCKKNNIKVVGHCHLPEPKHTMFIETNLDIGIVAKDEDDNLFWCHASSKWFKDWDIEL